MLYRAYYVIPSLVCLIAAIAAALPWGVPTSFALALPLVAFAVVVFWAIRHARQLPSPIVFALGLLMDMATGGPMGFWALNFLIGYAVGHYGPRWNAERRDGAGAFVTFATALAVVTIVGWLISSLYYLQLMPLRAPLIGALVSLAAFPVIAFLMGPLDRLLAHAVRQVSPAQEEGWP